MVRVPKRTLTLTVNGCEHELAVRPYDVLLDVLREELGFTGTKRGCDMGTCGCCNVIVGGRVVSSCLVLAHECEGAEITTIEGLDAGGPHPLQEAWVEAGASQCGFCTAGFILTAKALLASEPEPGEARIREAIAGNLCRCTGYEKIVAAIRNAAERQKAART